MRSAKVVGIGAVLFDILMTVPNFPAEDTKIQGLESKTQCGGPCATALVTVAKLGETAEYLGTLGDDTYGRYILKQLNHYGVATNHVRVEKGKQSFHSFVMLNLNNASRTCIWNRGTVDIPSFEDVDLNVLRSATFLHLDGHQLDAALYAARRAREFGVLVSLDAGGVYPGIEQLLPWIDILIPSEEFAMEYTGKKTGIEAAEILYKKYHPRTLIITQGKRGGFLWDGEEKRYPVFSVKAVDSNGAGDTFHGAFLYGKLKGYTDMDAAIFASAASALKCTRFGAQEGIPGNSEVIRFLKENGRGNFLCR